MKRSQNEIQIQEQFKNTGIEDYLCRCFSQSGFNRPTPIQYYSIKLGIANPHKNILARSKSGTGKTLSFLGILLNTLLKNEYQIQKTQSLIILPTRQLAMQVYQALKKLLEGNQRVKVQNQNDKKNKNKLKKLSVLLTIGGISFEEDKKNYRDRSANILVSTVGRLLELFSHKIVKLSNNPVIIFDEGDKLFEISDSKFWKLLKFIPSSVRKLVFSATYSKKALQTIVKNQSFIYVHTLKKEGKLDLKMTENMEQILQYEQKQEKQIQPQAMHLQNIKKYKIEIEKGESSYFDAKIKELKILLEQIKYTKCLVFIEKKALLQQISERLIDFDPLLIHGSLSQAARFRMMNKANNSKIIISSDLLARGIDLQIDLVILFDAKQTETFWHRIGRTGRYGRTGVAVSLDNIEDKQWKKYNLEEVNSILTQMTQTEQIPSKKVWYGEYMTEVTKWVDVNEQKQVKISKQQNYKYFNEEQVSKPKKRVKLQTQIPQFKSQHQLIQFINELLKCQKCMQVINNTSELTDYQFQILKYKKG